MNAKLVGYCRYCNAPILQGLGATCGHQGYLIYGPYEIFHQQYNGYDHYKSMSPLPQYTGPFLTDKDAAQIIEDILTSTNENLHDPNSSS